MSVLAPDRQDEWAELELLIKEARRRQRRRRLAIVCLVAVAGGAAYLGTRGAGSAPGSGSLLVRPLHVPALKPGGRCPASAGYMVNNSGFGAMTLGRGPVRVALADAGDLRRGRVLLGPGGPPGWHALQTLWFAIPGYNGPFVVRGARLGRRGPIEVQPGQSGLAPGSGPLVVPAGPTSNSYPPPGPGTYHGFRTVPGSTWVKSPGCYAWQVDGRGFTEVIVVDAVGVYHPARQPGR